MNKKKNGFSSVGVVITVVIIIAIIGAVFFFLQASSNKPTPQADQMQSGTPSVKINDMAPALPASQKTSLLIRHSDSTYEKVIIPNENVNTYVTSLPEGDTVVGNISPTK